MLNDLNEKISLHVDDKLLKIVFENLIENALTFRQPMKNFLHIKDYETAEGYHIVFEDNGIGVSPQYQTKIFDMFYRASDLSNGSGLGLYLVKKAIEKMEGAIGVESENGKFSRFTVSLPLSAVIRPREEKGKKEKAPAA